MAMYATAWRAVLALLDTLPCASAATIKMRVPRRLAALSSVIVADPGSKVQPLPGRHLTDHQVRLSKSQRQVHRRLDAGPSRRQGGPRTGPGWLGSITAVLREYVEGRDRLRELEQTFRDLLG